jgi:hypothetical protein
VFSLVANAQSSGIFILWIVRILDTRFWSDSVKEEEYQWGYKVNTFAFLIIYSGIASCTAHPSLGLIARLFEQRQSRTMISSEDIFAVLPEFFLYGAAAGVVGFFFFFWLATIVLPNMTPPSFQEKVKALSPKDRYLLYTLVPSTVHALVQMGHPAYISLGFSAAHTADKVTYFDEKWPVLYMGVFVGYLMGDFCTLGPKILAPVFEIHHLAASACWTMSAHLHSMQWYASFLQFCEFSTFFLNYRQILLTAGYTSSDTEVTLASLGLFLSFGAVRVAPLPGIMYGWVTRDYGVFRDKNGQGAAAVCCLFFAIHAGLQTFWFGLMVKKLLSAVLGKKKKTE